MISGRSKGSKTVVGEHVLCKNNGMQFSLKSLKLSALTMYGLRFIASKLGRHLSNGNDIQLPA